MAQVRRLEDLPTVIAQMAKTSAGLSEDIIPALAKGVRDEVDRQGSRYHIKGRGGRPVPLGARVQRAKGASGRYSATRSVDGVPAGFWRIIEEGSSPHLIAGRYRASGRRRSARVAVRQFARNADAFGGSPINIPGVGWRQYAVHPGHRSVGRPWARAMQNSDQVVADVLKRRATEELLSAWNL